MFVVFTDTDNDVSPKEAEEFGFQLINMPYSIDGQEYNPYSFKDGFDDKEFYDMLRNGTLPKTSSLSMENYINYFEPFLKEGKDILYLHFSHAMSGTFTAMDNAIKELKERYPEREIFPVDAMGISFLGKIMVYGVADLYRKGKDIQDIIKWVEYEREHVAGCLFASDLKFFARSGRVKGFKAFVGNLLGIKPIIYMNEVGELVSSDTARGKISAINKLVEYAERLQENINNYRVVIGHSDCLETANLLAEKLRERFGDLDIIIDKINPVIGAHCGPDVVGFSFHAKHR